MSTCDLCSLSPERVFFQGKLIIGVWADPAVSPGHAMLVTRRHVTDWFAASQAEQQELMAALAEVRDAILEQHLPDGFNIGIHIGSAAGQEVPHLHVDVVPRYRQPAAQAADVEEPAPVELKPRKRTDDWGREAPVVEPVVEPVLDRLERELEAQAQHDPTPEEPDDGKVTQLPGTTRTAPADAVDGRDNTQPLRGLSAVPATAVSHVAEADSVDESDEPSTAYARAPSLGSGSDGYAGTYDTYDDLYDDESVTRLPGHGKKWVVLLVVLLLAGGGGYAYYWVRTSPYIGEPPAHLKIDPKLLKPARATEEAPGDAAAKIASEELPSAKRGRKALAPARMIPGTTTPAPGGASPGATAAAAPGAPSSEYDRLMARASELIAKRKRREAYKLLDKALEVQPDGWQALQHLAWRDAKAGRLGRALKRARAALKANRNAPYANLVLGVAMHERDRTAAARAGYARFLKHCKGCPETGEIRRVLRSLSEEE